MRADPTARRTARRTVRERLGAAAAAALAAELADRSRTAAERADRLARLTLRRPGALAASARPRLQDRPEAR